jgi:hypothetical protein
VERQIASELAGRYPIGTPTVVCTEDIAARPGETFSCSTLIDGQPLLLAGTVTDRRGHFTVTPDAAIVDTRRAESHLERQIASSLRSPVTVECGPRPVLVLDVGQTFACTARINGQPARRVSVTVEDLAGRLRFNLPPLPPGGTAASTVPS